MTPETVAHLMNQTLMTSLTVSAPLLLIGLGVGIAINLLQIVTSLQDSAVGAVPRLAAFAVGLLLLLPWLIGRLMAYTTALFSDFGRYAR